MVVLGKTYTANAMRPLPGFLLLCASYRVTAIANDFFTGKNGLDYCIAEADTTSDMTASTTMAAPTCALPWWTSLAPYMSATTWAPGVCEHNPNRAEGSEQWVQSVSSSTFEPAICIDNPFLKDLSINWQLGSEHFEDTCASPHTTSQAIEHMPQPAPEASFRVQSSEAKGASCGTI